MRISVRTRHGRAGRTSSSCRSLFEGQTLGVIELASVNEFTAVHQDLLEQLKETIGVNVNTIVANSRTEALLVGVPTACAGTARPVRRTPATAGRTAAFQHRTRREGGPAGQPEPRHRGQEHRDRAGQPGARGTCPAAVDGIDVQVGVPGQHVPRAADAAEQRADPGRAAGRQPRGQPERAADRVRQDHPLGRHRPAADDRRRTRPRQGGSRPHGAAAGAGGGRRPRRRTSSRCTGRWRPTRRWTSRSRCHRRCLRPCTPTGSVSSRSCATCCPTRSSSPTREASGCTSARPTRQRSTARRCGPCRPGSPSSSRTPGSASPRTSSHSSSRRSSRPTVRPAGSTAAPDWACPSARS